MGNDCNMFSTRVQSKCVTFNSLTQHEAAKTFSYQHLQGKAGLPLAAALAQSVPCSGLCTQDICFSEPLSTDKEPSGSNTKAIFFITVDEMRAVVHVPTLILRDPRPKPFHTSRWVSCF